MGEETLISTIVELANQICYESITFKELSEKYSSLQSHCRSHLVPSANKKPLVELGQFNKHVEDEKYLSNELIALTIQLDAEYPHESLESVMESLFPRVKQFSEHVSHVVVNEQLIALSLLLQSNLNLTINDLDYAEEEDGSENEDELNADDEQQQQEDDEEDTEEKVEEVTLTKHQEEADKLLDSGIAKYPEFSLFYRNKASLYNSTELNHSLALEYIETAKSLCLEPSLYYTEGLIRQDLKMHEEAIPLFEQVIQVDPKDGFAYYNLARSYDAIGECEKAIEKFTKAIEFCPDFAPAYVCRGKSYGSIDQIDKALADYNKAIEIDETNGDAYYERGLIYRDLLNDNARATVEFEKAVEVDPDSEEKQVALLSQEKLNSCNQDIAESEADDYSVYVARGQLYLELMGKPTLAKADFDHAASLSSGSSQAIVYLNRGYANIELGLFKEALADLQKATELDTTESQTYSNKAKEAITELQDALASS